jgi:hypothetical protein
MAEAPIETERITLSQRGRDRLKVFTRYCPGPFWRCNVTFFWSNGIRSGSRSFYGEIDRKGSTTKLQHGTTIADIIQPLSEHFRQSDGHSAKYSLPEEDL